MTSADRVCYGHAENFFKFSFVNFNSVTLRLVHHIQIYDERDSLLHKLNRQKKISRHIRRVNNIDDNIGLVLFEIIADNLLFLRAGVHRISSGQVNDRNFSAFVLNQAGFFIDGNAGPIPNFLPRPRQLVKNCRFPCVGIACQSN